MSAIDKDIQIVYALIKIRHTEDIMRLGINIPNSLYKRMGPIKQRVNISQICRDAIEEWVNAYEGSLDKAKQDGMEELLKQIIIKIFFS